MPILIFANGDIEGTDWLRPRLKTASSVIAADGGARHLHQLQHLPDLVIGDLDSLPPEIARWLQEGAVAADHYPREKDETDLELALLHAAAGGDEEIHIIGALGGRLDQTLANILLLAHPALAKHHVQLVTRDQRAWLVTDDTQVNGRIGDTVSLIPIGGDVLVQSTSGLRWPLTDTTLTVGPALGVSNVLTEPTATITVGRGTLLCIHTRQEWQR